MSTLVKKEIDNLKNNDMLKCSANNKRNKVVTI